MTSTSMAGTLEGSVESGYAAADDEEVAFHGHVASFACPAGPVKRRRWFAFPSGVPYRGRDAAGDGGGGPGDGPGLRPCGLRRHLLVPRRTGRPALHERVGGSALAARDPGCT